METKEILKYRRNVGCWLCTECESENDLSLYQCAVCGTDKSASAIILNPGEDAAIYNIPVPGKTEEIVDDLKLGRVYSERIPEADGRSGGGKVAVWIIVILLIAILFSVFILSEQGMI